MSSSLGFLSTSKLRMPFLLSAIFSLVGCVFVTSNNSPVVLVPSYQWIQNDKCVSYCPAFQESHVVLDRGAYILSYNPDTKFADWVAYRVEPQNFGKTKRHRNWKIDPDLDKDHALTKMDFAGAYLAPHFYDKGHQAPLGSFTDHNDWSKTNYLSNITPQKSALNEGPWRMLEERVRRLAKQKGKVYVITGTIYAQDNSLPLLPSASKTHQVPSAYWKVVLVNGQDKWHSASFIMSQSLPRNADFCKQQSTIEEISQQVHGPIFRDLTPINDLAPKLGC